MNFWEMNRDAFVQLQRLVSDDNTFAPSSSPADNGDNVNDVEDGDSRRPISTVVTDTEAAEAAGIADDHDDDVVTRNLQKRQSVASCSFHLFFSQEKCRTSTFTGSFTNDNHGQAPTGPELCCTSDRCDWEVRPWSVTATAQ